MLEPESGGCQGNGCEEVSGELVVARGDAAEVFEFVEEAFDEVALSVEVSVDGALLPAAALGWNVRSRSMVGDHPNDGLGVVAAVRHGVGGGPQAVEQRGDEGFVGGLAGRDEQADGKASGVDHRVKLGAQSSTRTADGVIRAPFFPPAAC